MPRLSLCVIARDEAELLPGLLESVAGVVDEVVLIDTGSRDATASIAREAGAIVGFAPWEDDFSAARNASLALATGEFALVLDADERLAPGAGVRLRAALEGATFDCGTLRLHDAARLDAPLAEVVAGSARQGSPIRLPRLLRRTADLRYTGLVHESVSDWLASRGMRLADLDVDIVHLGYVAEVRAQRGKRDRNVALLRRRCALEPDSVTPRGELALQLVFEGELAEAAEVAERGWALLPRQPPGRSILRLALARAISALERGDAERALESVERAWRTEGPGPDLDHLRGRALLQQAAGLSGEGRERALTAAEASFRAALAAGARETPRQFVAGSASQASACGLGEALLCAGRDAEARAAFAAALEKLPESVGARLGEVELLVRCGEAPAALARVEGLLDASPDGWLLAASAAHALGAAEDARALAREAQARRGKFRAAHRAALLEALARELGIG